MRTYCNQARELWIAAGMLAAAMLLGTHCVLAASGQTVVVTQPTGLKLRAAVDGSDGNNRVLIEAIDVDREESKNKDVAWLGIATEEASDALSAQLGLKSGEGLVVSYVAPNSPAAKAGLQKNDVLVEFEEQLLVHPGQFRKLIRLHQEGDKIQLTLSREGKKQRLEVTLGKTSAATLDEPATELRLLPRRLKELHLGDATREEMKHLQDSVAEAGIDKETLNHEVQRSIEQVRRSIQLALRQYTNATRTFGPAAREFQELAKRGLDVEKDATVVVKSKQNSVRSMVRTDESGTYVIVASPKKQLTAHDKSGKLLFDGQIETPEEQDKVPRDLWEKVQPMLRELNEDHPEAENPEHDKNQNEK
jgi:membrane-associated protease RseP (regulator of RpoE activity)